MDANGHLSKDTVEKEQDPFNPRVRKGKLERGDREAEPFERPPSTIDDVEGRAKVCRRGKHRIYRRNPLRVWRHLPSTAGKIPWTGRWDLGRFRRSDWSRWFTSYRCRTHAVYGKSKSPANHPAVYSRTTRCNVTVKWHRRALRSIEATGWTRPMEYPWRLLQKWDLMERENAEELHNSKEAAVGGES